MALNLVYPLKKGTYYRVRGFASHEKWNPGTWYGVDEGCKVGTKLYAVEAGKVSHAFKPPSTDKGGGWNFRLNLTKYPGWFLWYAHCSAVPKNGARYSRGQELGRSGATGGVTGPHLHYSLMQGSTPRDPDSKSVVNWGEVDMYKGKTARYWYVQYAAFKKKSSALAIQVASLKKINQQTVDKLVQTQNRLTVVEVELDLTKRQMEGMKIQIELLEQRLAEEPPEEPEEPGEPDITPEEIDAIETDFTGLWERIKNLFNKKLF